MLPNGHRLVVHGGAGVITRGSLTAEQEALIHGGLRDALHAGEKVLMGGGTALDAVTAAVCVLEDCPWFNAGRGSVLNRDGVCEMDASVMDGNGRRAGAVAAVKRPRNPVLGARAVLEKSTHVLLAGDGADAFLAGCGVTLEDPLYFVTEARVAQWRRVLGEWTRAGGSGPAASPGKVETLWKLERKTDAFGTVGAVARDVRGNLAAATSTGGLAGKTPGRVGDSPIIGAGTWADNATCAISATGHGEHFIRNAVAHEVAARVAHGGLTLEEAARRVVMEDLAGVGGEGGLIAIDRDGRLVMPFNTPGMYRGWLDPGGTPLTAIYR